MSFGSCLERIPDRFLALDCLTIRTMQRASKILQIVGITTRFVHVLRPAIVVTRFSSSSSTPAVLGVNVTKTTKLDGTAATPVVSPIAGADKGVKGVVKEACGTAPPLDDEEEDMEEMFIQGPAGMEWGGPTRGGQRPEPTRYGDWERKGRASDF